MAARSGWDPGLPPTAVDGRPTVPEWMGGGGLGQLQILSLYAADGEKRLCPFIVGKSIDDLVGEIEATTTESSGLKYVLRVRDSVKVKKLLNMTALFDGTVVKVELHPILNKRRCVISCREIQHKSEEELLEWMGKEGVVGVKRITRMQEGKPVNTPTLILTINGTAVPETIKVGALRVKPRIYVPDPMICYKCFAYGHSKFRCKSEARCRNCSQVHDLDGECKAVPFCMHCQGGHGPASRSCPVYSKEKEIVRLRFTKGITYEEALKQYQAGSGSYASVSKIQQRLVNAPLESEQLKAKDEIIKQLMDTITKLTSRIEELEKKSRSKKEKKRAKRNQAIQDEGSGSEMETDSSAKQPTTGATGGDTSKQVSAALTKSNVPKHKRHPTTEIHAPIAKKPLASYDQSQRLPDHSRPPPIEKPLTSSPGIIDHLQSLMDSARLDPSHSQSANGQHNKHSK